VLDKLDSAAVLKILVRASERLDLTVQDMAQEEEDNQ